MEAHSYWFIVENLAQKVHNISLHFNCANDLQIKNNKWSTLNYIPSTHHSTSVATPLWAKCEDETHTPKRGNLESFGTPKNSKLDCRGQNNSHLGVFYVIGKVLKCRCPKWPCMNHLESEAQVMGKRKAGSQIAVWLPTTKSRESTRIQRLQVECDMALESSLWKLQDFLKPHPNRRSEQEVMDAQSPGSANRDSFGTPLWESEEKVSFECSLSKELQIILYGGRWWLPPSAGRGESNESKLLVACPNTKGVPECELTHLWLVLDAGSCNKIIVPLPSLIPKLLARPSHPL
jgi:hypothetical protein